MSAGVGAKREWAFRIASVLLGLAAPLLLAEAALRVRAVLTGRNPTDEFRKTFTAFPPPVEPGCPRSAWATLGQLVRPSRDPGIVYELKPDIEACFLGSY